MNVKCIFYGPWINPINNNHRKCIKNMFIIFCSRRVHRRLVSTNEWEKYLKTLSWKTITRPPLFKIQIWKFRISPPCFVYSNFIFIFIQLHKYLSRAARGYNLKIVCRSVQFCCLFLIPICSTTTHLDSFFLPWKVQNINRVFPCVTRRKNKCTSWCYFI